MTVETSEAAPHRSDPAAPAERPEAHARRIGALDAIRGLAILFVIVGHYLPFNLVQGSAALILSPFAQGGVILFFLLSGFLIDNNLGRDGNLARYGLRRVFRIIPAYWVALVVIFVFEGFLTHDWLFSPREVAINALLLNDIIPAALISGVFWTLLIESKFYMAAPAVKQLGERATFLLPFALLLLNLAVLATRHQSSNLLTYITYCFVGMQFSLWRRGVISLPQLAAVIVLVAATTPILVDYYKAGVTVLAVVDLALLGWALSADRPIFDIAALRIVGAVSYSWYLYHAAIGYPILAALRSDTIPGGLAAVAAATLATFVVAYLSYRYIELSGIALGRRLARAAPPLDRGQS